MKYEYWYANTKGIGNKQKRKIRAQVASSEELYYMEEKELKKIIGDEKFSKQILESRKEWNLEEEYGKLMQKQIEFIPFFDERYPERLINISAPPYGLYVKGKLPQNEILSVAIVGARNCSAYGAAMAKDFAKELAEAGVQIISGMAMGIDGVAQKSALDAGGRSFGILACGVDICYPKENFGIYMELLEKGGLISEQPPETQPFRNYFPARNRIISGLADVVLVIEAKERSGSLITADMALEQGKEIYALPGNITSALSRGCHNLIKQGAGILLSPKDLMDELGIFYKNEINLSKHNKKLLENIDNIVYSCLDFEPKNPSQVCELTGISIREAVNSLVNLELGGYVREVSKNYYVKVK